MFDLILHVLQGKASEEEVERVKEWLEEQENNKQVYREISESYYQLQAMRQWDSLDVAEALKATCCRFDRKNRFRRRMNWFSGVAAMLLLFLGSFFLLRQPEKHWTMVLSEVSEIPETQAGEKKAVLTLADGRQIELNAKNTVMNLGHVRAEEDSTGGLVYRKMNDSAELMTDYNILTVPWAGEYILTLSDGTRVWLNSETQLRYPVVFARDSRMVYVEGEAYFDVVPDPERPFVVRTAVTETLVRGTAFNVMAYRDEDKTEVTLVRGAVSIEAGGKTRQIVPGQQIRVDNHSGDMQERKVNPSYYASWKDGLFDFEGMSLEELSIKLSRWYDVDFFFVNPEAGKKKFTGAIKRSNSLQFMLDFICQTSGVRFVVKGKTVTVYNSGK